MSNQLGYVPDQEKPAVAVNYGLEPQIEGEHIKCPRRRLGCAHQGAFRAWSPTMDSPGHATPRQQAMRGGLGM